MHLTPLPLKPTSPAPRVPVSSHHHHRPRPPAKPSPRAVVFLSLASFFLSLSPLTKKGRRGHGGIGAVRAVAVELERRPRRLLGVAARPRLRAAAAAPPRAPEMSAVDVDAILARVCGGGSSRQAAPVPPLPLCHELMRHRGGVRRHHRRPAPPPDATRRSTCATASPSGSSRRGRTRCTTEDAGDGEALVSSCFLGHIGMQPGSSSVDVVLSCSCFPGALSWSSERTYNGGSMLTTSAWQQ